MPDFLAKANTNTVLLVLIAVTLGGTELVPMLNGPPASEEVVHLVAPDPQAVELRRRLDAYEQRERDEELKAEIRQEFREALADAINTSIAPLIETIAQISRNMQLGERWSIEDMSAYHEADGMVAPREIQSKRLAEERRAALEVE